jgi:diamine N-acetyltransferase
MSELFMREVTQENWRAAMQLGVAPEQQHFVAGVEPVVALALAKAYIRPAGLLWVPYVFFADSDMVGFAELAYEPGSLSNYWLFHFFIDRRFQGHGYGKKALQVFLHYIRDQHPNCQTFSLTVHPENHRAQHLYESAGFRPAGKEIEEELLYQLKMYE